MKKAILISLAWLALTGNAALAEETSGFTVKELLKTSTSWNGAALPAYPAGKPEITIARIIIQPGVAMPWHEHPMINAGVLLSGELTVTTIDQKVLHLKAGDAIAEVVNTWHYGKNEGKVPAEIVVFYAGSTGVPTTIKKEN